MRNFLSSILILLITFSAGASDIRSKPVEGTWINLFWQDERNNYMNPSYIDGTSPELWKLKVRELHEIGIRYIVIMAVANEGKAAYPSDFMEHSYPNGRQSPVSAIMEQADECGMDVFMSCGWARNMLDDLSDPEVKATQLRIMEETSELYSHHKSFFGWYLPVEDSFEPVLSEHAVSAANWLAEKARNLTPGKQVMISPYGLCHADFKSPRFAERIKQLNVDIIAYQDEVGCVREPMPMKRMKEHFKILGDIHKESGIRFWANIESFTWDRKTNSWYSTLVPAAFGRYLSQIAGVNQAGVETILSFSIFGIYDKPGSEIPLGQPVYSGIAYNDYTDWLSGKGRWPFLEWTFYGKSSHEAIGCEVHSGNKNVSCLTDGVTGCENTKDMAWRAFGNGKMVITIDMGGQTDIKTVAARFMNYRIADISIPYIVDIYVSDNGKSYEKVRTVFMEISPNDRHDCWIDVALAENLDTKGRYIRIAAENRTAGTQNPNKIYCDEIFINPEMDGSIYATDTCNTTKKYIAADSDIPENKVFIPADTSAVQYIGRTCISDGKVSFDWTGTKMATVVKNTGTFAISAYCKGESYFNVFIDGIQYDTIRISGDTLVTVAQDLDKEIHEIALQKRSEGEFGKMTVNGFILDSDAQIKSPDKKKRLIEFIGDSITCGYGVEGNDREDPFLVSTENSGLSYASLIADYFNADCTLIAHSGRGAARNYGDSLSVSDITMKDLMLRTFDSEPENMWDFSRYKPDIVVINLGSNDFSTKPHPSEEEFVNAYKTIISRLRKNYGNIPIMCVGPRVGEPAITYIKAICQSANDENLYFGGSLEGVNNNTSDLGAAWHPGITGQQKIAMTLIPRISTITGWPLADRIH